MSVSSRRDSAATIINTTEPAALSFNISFSVNLGSLMHFPSRLLARMRKLDDMLLNSDLHSNVADNAHEGSLMRRMRPERSTHAGLPLMPGPWSFFASGYAIALFAMALLLNRIQHIVAPSRHPLPYRMRFDGVHGLHGTRSRLSFLRYIYSSLFPVDLSSTFARTLFRVPTLYLLFKSLALWSVILLQTSGFFPSAPQWAWLQNISQWAGTKEMEDVCWSTFGAVCGALCVGALTRGLEGVGTSNTSPFNLFGYAFLLHLYSSPLTHALNPEGSPSRPDMHVVITILMPLLQLSMIHFLGVKQSWSNQRLVPTTICSLLTLLHFHSVLWFSPASYPLLNYMSCIFESLLIVVTLLAFALNALTQILLEGAVTRPFFGHAATLMPKWDEDFSIVLLRLGTASLEATSVAGLGNEVSAVPVAEPADAKAGAYGEVQMNRVGVTSVSHARDGRRRKDGFANEIRHVKVGGGHQDPWFDVVWVRELGRFGMELRKFAKGAALGVWAYLRGRTVYRRHPGPERAQNEDEDAGPGGLAAEPLSEGTAEPQDDAEHARVYQRFLAGEAVSDDEDDFSPRFADDNDDEEDDDESPDADGADNGSETARLYADLSATATSTATAPLLLAHMTDSSATPLTRRRYGRLVSGSAQAQAEEQAQMQVPASERADGGGGGEADWGAFVRERQVAASVAASAAAQDEGLAERRRNCVICTVEERQIICWPCRCLALCDDCRENLASRFTASKHTCPCCRQPVEGFSRIYIP
ncbi:hypothetical protein EVG20_g5753 [Dentipellis fragilis]|uniref:RING-type domain-containing protein n=1 Tax=Dentipellis fragilis TaxID=205917 RepID=A0A4Y9YQZ4_9AGAM|nr:hypothetical protein EVG20_g5753 [Dentipellis fragilis]